MRASVKDGFRKAGHERTFRPSKNVRNYKFKVPYSHHVERIEIKKDYRDRGGRVKLGPPNFYTSGHKSGLVGPGTTFSVMPYVAPYDVAK